jgi:exodeoxyribonuclease V alpha subunit
MNAPRWRDGHDLTLPAARRLGEAVGGLSDRYLIYGEVLALHVGSHADGSWQAGSLVVGTNRVPFVAIGVPGLEVGCLVAVEGVWGNHPDFGIQLSIVACRESQVPTERTGLIRYLTANVEGLGSRRAEAVILALGAESTLHRLLQDPHVVTRVVPGKRGEQIAAAVREWAKQVEAARWAVEVAPWLLGVAGIGYSLARRIANFFDGPDVADIVARRSPYRLLDVPGVDWARADAVARGLGVAADSDERVDAALRVSVEALMASEGHTSVPVDRLLRETERLAHVGHGSVRGALSRAIEYCVVEARADGTTVHLPQVRDRDWAIAEAVDALVEQRCSLTDVEGASVDEGLNAAKLTVEQESAVRTSIGSGLSVITGGPGTGKTHALRALVACARDIGLDVCVVAPTGKAAARASQMVKVEASTIHRLLGAPVGGLRDTGPIRAGMLVVEEASMLDQEVAAWLAVNVKPGGALRVVMVGDDQQLPSVAPGRVLSDILESGVVPISRLTVVHRQAANSRIVQQASRVLRRQPLLEGETHDWTMVELPVDADDARALVLRTVRRVVAQERRSVLRDAPLDPRKGLQVLSPRAGGLLGSDGLNVGLRLILNRHGDLGPYLRDDQQARVGDRVICTRNDYTVRPHGLMNGEHGVVVSMSKQELTLQLDDGRVVRTNAVQSRHLAHAFALTVHRSQGSEYPVVVIVYHHTHGRLLDRRLLYTALTRARERVILCADAGALARSSANDHAGQRRSDLANLLRARRAPRPS